MLKNNILLINSGSFGSLFPEISMALLYLSWALRKKGFDIEILDTRVEDYKKIKSADYLFVGISTLTGSAIKQGINVAKHIRQLNKNVPIVWGGVHVTLLAEQSLKSPYVDIVVRGEGEITVQKLAKQLQINGDLTSVKGISYKSGNEIISNPDREFMNLNDIDIDLPYELFDFNKYSFISFPIHTSRGCPYRCGFCYNTAFNKRSWRAKSAEKVLDEIEYVVKKFKCKNIDFVWEDEFFIDIKRVRQISEGIINRGLDIEWRSFCRFNNFKKVDDDTLSIIEKSGCVSLTFGGESGSQRILDDVVKKDITIQNIIEATKRLSRTNIGEIVSFMTGFPSETNKDMDATFELIDKLKKNNKKLNINGIFLYTPYPGTPMFDVITEQYAYKAPSSLEEWADYGIYRNIEATWHKKDHMKKCKVISILTRFPFYKDTFKLNDVKDTIAGERMSEFPFNVAYYLLANLAIYRWKYKFFKFPIEFIMLEKYLEKKRGFV